MRFCVLRVPVRPRQLLYLNIHLGEMSVSQKPKVAILTAGGLAPCLSSAVGGLIERYTELAPEVEIIGYLGGYKGLLLGQSVPVTAEVRANAKVLHKHGGSPIKNSRVKLTNVADCLKRGLVKEGQDPLQVGRASCRERV